MSQDSQGTVTAFLHAMGRGEPQARDGLWSAVYEELRAIAGSLMRRESASHTLQPTAVVNEAYMRLLGGEDLRHKSRAYFFSAAAQAMRRILIEHARKHPQAKGRGGAAQFVLENLTVHRDVTSPADLEALDAALDALADHDQRAHDVLMLRFFAGLTVEDTADLLETSPRTVKRCWTYGRTWLYRRITKDGQ